MKNQGGRASRACFRQSLCCALALLVLLIAAPALANVVGMKVSVTNVDNDNREATFDLTAYQNAADGFRETLGGNLLDRTGSQNYTTTYDFGLGYAPTNYQVNGGFSSDWNTSRPPAVEYGDGVTAQTATLALNSTVNVEGEPIRVYRAGSFTHTYPDVGSFTITGRAGPDGRRPGTSAAGLPGLGPAATFSAITGNPVTGNLTNNFSFYFRVYRTVAPATAVFSLATNYANQYTNTVRYLSNAVDVTFTGGPTGGGDPLEIPTLSDSWLLILALMIAGTGIFLIKRP